MADWKFTNDYATTYPALSNSILNYLVFSDHTIDGTDFSGTLDVAASNGVLTTLGAMVGLDYIVVSGTVAEEEDKLTVNFTTDPNDLTFATAFANIISLFKNKVDVSILAINTVVGASQPEPDPTPDPEPDPTPDPEPDPTPTSDTGIITDEFNLHLTISIASGTADIVSQVPINGGMLNLTGDFTGLAIGLDDLDFLMGKLGEDGEHSWFPNDELEVYMDKGPELCLINLTLSAFVDPNTPTSINISSVGVTVGLTQLSLLGEKLYMDPLGVVITLTDTSDNSITPTFTWGLVGSAKLCNYDNQGVDGLASPDFEFDFAMDFPNTPDFPIFSFSGELENETDGSVNEMLKDLISQNINIGLVDELTVNSFDINSEADMNTGTITSFYTSIDMSGGFGLLDSFDLEEISVTVDYSE